MRAPITDKQLLEMMWERFPEIMKRGTEQPAQHLSGLAVYLDPSDGLKPKRYAPQPAQQEPVVRWDSDGWGDLLVDSLPDGTLLYTSSSPQRTWVGLTEKEILECRSANHLYFYKAIEAKLKEKNT